ncbi:uncharacterized protein LOC110452921 [Mizuhopecten yessoensis]|uniref:uncharacterized protein LOC110452921 n=1 Tax=Mizuhopecten yessoensis TaxID=6573 RepID=UPI000B45BF4C|nr:uncharacterized protein LOC110452921 [Mizuhopecten yessoensis]
MKGSLQDTKNTRELTSDLPAVEQIIRGFIKIVNFRTLKKAKCICCPYGNAQVWHGNMDIIVNYEVPIVVGTPPKENPDSPESKSPVEVNLNITGLSRNHEIMAKTIVFSYLQKYRHPESDNFLCPCIGVTFTDLIIFFYDSEHDILLERSVVPLHSPKDTSVAVRL